MDSPAPQAAAPSRFERVWDGPILVRLRAYVLPSVAFAVPVYFAQKLLQHLSGGALWHPREWRELVAVFGTLVGLAVFNWARLKGGAEEVPHAPPKRGGGRDGKTPAPGVAAQHFGEERRRQVLSLRWYGAALLCIAGYTFLRHHCVHPWQPREDWLELAGVREGGAEAMPSFIELAPHAAPVAVKSAEVHGSTVAPESATPTEASDSPRPSVPATDTTTAAEPFEPAPRTEAPPRTTVWRGSFLTPIWFSSKTRAELDRRERERGGDGVQYCLQQDEDWLIDALTDDETISMPVTTLAFLLLHLGVLACAAAGFGSSFALSEELAAKLAEIA